MKRNVVLIGCQTGEPLTKDEVVKGAARLREEWGNVPLLEIHAKHMSTMKVRTDDVPSIVDDVTGSERERGFMSV